MKEGDDVVIISTNEKGKLMIEGTEQSLVRVELKKGKKVKYERRKVENADLKLQPPVGLGSLTMSRHSLRRG